MNKTLYTLSLCLSSLLAFSCTNSISNINQEVKNVNHAESVVDLSNYTNIKTNKSLTVTINAKTFAGFKIKGIGEAQSLPIDIKSYKLNLCTNPAQPIDTKVAPVSLSLDRDIITNPIDPSNNWSHTVTFKNVSPNSTALENYYATIEAYDDTTLHGNGNNITAPNNDGVTYTGASSPNAQVAVSSNFVHFDSDQILHFTPSTKNTLEVDINLKALVMSSGDYQVDSGTALDNQKKPSIGTNSNGNGLMVWQDSRGTNTIYARELRNYIPVKGSDFILVSSVTNKTPSNPVISVNSTGNWVAVWQELDSLSGKNTIKYQTASNYKALLAPLNVATTIGSDQVNPDIKIDENGNGLVVWSDNRLITTAKYRLHYKKMVNYATSGSEAVLSSTSASTQKQSNPKIMINNAGEGLVVWEDEPTVLGDPNIAAIKILGYIKNGSDIRIDQDGSNAGLERLPNLSLDYSGNGLVVWKDSRAGVEKLYYRKIVGFTTMPANEAVFFDTSTSGSGSLISDTREPSITLNSFGTGLISWSYNDLATPTTPARRIYASNVTAYVPNSTPSIVDSGLINIDKVAPFIGMNSAGNGIIAWQDDPSNGDIYARNIKAYIPQ